MKILILGGAGEAARLAQALADQPEVTVTTSLAGRTSTPPPLAGRVRVGGFGGPEKLTEYLRAEGFDKVIDATHPFAARISANAAQACAAAGTPRLILARPPWARQAGDTWIEAASMAEAAQRLPEIGRRAFLTVGMQSIPVFSTVASVWFLVRLLHPQPLPLAQYAAIDGKGPFNAEAEQSLMAAHRIDVLVTKTSGGSATYGKIAAARALGLPVLMIARPPMPAGECVGDVDQAVEWVLRGQA